MKKTFLILSLAIFCFSCSNNQNGSEATASSTSENPQVEKGMNLVAKSDCLGCHKINETSVGPAYNLVAAKYTNTEESINTLAEKVQKGGSGNWGAVPMAAHPNISKEDAELMVKYVLSLKDVK
ncbi:MAG: c-type cytochrome [Ferruginibacter sp.]